jgi:hypothetical protein
MIRHLFVVGAQRSGTTYLYHTLNQHPAIEMAKPAIPEPKYFLKNGSEHRVDAYLEQFFEGKPGITWRGEKSASYIESEAAAARLAKAFPEATILFILRDPVKRAVSNYWYTNSYQLEDQPIEILTSEIAQQRRYNDISVSPYSYLNRGKYVDYLDMYTNYFPREQMKILTHEQYIQDVEALRDLYDCLGVDSSYVPQCFSRRVNESPYGPNPTPEHVLQFLRDFYSGYNTRLAEQYGIDVQKWWQQPEEKPAVSVQTVTMLESEPSPEPARSSQPA